MVNLAQIRKKAADIRGALVKLRAIAARSPADFLADDIVMSAAKYQLLVAVEAALDLCGHITARRLGKAPEGYADCFRLLAGGGVITAETSAQLTAMARFRNLLVHQYGEIDDRRVYEILRDHLGDLETYLSEVGQYLGDSL